METTNKKETACVICGKLYVQSSIGFGLKMPDCDCEMRQKEQEAASNKYMTNESFLEKDGNPGRAIDYSFESFEEIIRNHKSNGINRDFATKTLARVKTWCNQKYPGILLMAGNTGVGKTGLAASAIKYLAKKGRLPVRYYYAYDLLTKGVNFDTREKALEAALRPQVMVIDEIGIQLRSEPALAFLERVLVGRHEDGKITIIIANEQPESFWQITGERVKDRIMRAGEMIAFTGGSLREIK
jgi:DNA replication protein DnaC